MKFTHAVTTDTPNLSSVRRYKSYEDAIRAFRHRRKPTTTAPKGATIKLVELSTDNVLEVHLT